MKRAMVVCVGATLLSGCMTPEQWAYVKQPVPTAAPQEVAVAPPPAPQAEVAQPAPVVAPVFHGCLGKAIDACLSGLELPLEITLPDLARDQLKKNDAVDINGRPISTDKAVVVLGKLRDASRPTQVTTILNYDASRVVTSVSVSISGDPEMAHTEDEYRDSNLFEMFSIALGDSCPSMDRLGVYKFFENQVKPKIVREDEAVDVSMNGASDTYQHHATALYCGARFKYSLVSGNDTNLITLDNEHGVFVNATITFETKKRT